MRFIALIFPALLALPSSGASMPSIQTPMNAPVASQQRIPGSGGFSHCDSHFTDDVFQISSISITPPPKLDQILLLEFDGIFLQDVLAKTQVHVTTSINGFESETYIDLCDFADEVRQSAATSAACPPRRSHAVLRREKLFPRGYPEVSISCPYSAGCKVDRPSVQGNYVFTFDANMPDGKRLFCVTANIYMKA